MISKNSLLKLYFLIGALESAATFVTLLSIPSDPKNAMLWGYSLQRLMLLGGSFTIFVFLGLFCAWIYTSAIGLGKTIKFVDGILEVRWKYSLLSTISLTLLFIGFMFFLLPLEKHAGYAAQAERITPIVLLGIFIGIQTLAGQYYWLEKKLNWRILLEWKRVFWVAAGTLGIILSFSAWVVWSQVGLTPEKYGWHSPGTPIVFFQLMMAWFLGFPFLLWDGRVDDWLKNLGARWGIPLRLDMIICLFLWLTAILVWWGEPIRRESYFTPTPTPPNFEYYPYSDAAFYDRTAQNILIGESQNNKYILRPLYVFFLAFLHVIGGQEYNAVIFWQIVFLALAPVFAFLLTSMVGGRMAGIISAILFIIREKNAIALTNVIEVSHSKLIMADMLMTTLMLAFVYLYVNWLRRPNRPDPLGVLAGASFGLVVLVRSQALLIIPFLLLGVAFINRTRSIEIMRRTLLFIVGFSVVVGPWVWRNYEVSGRPAIENSEFYISSLASGYTESRDSLEILPGESPEDHYSRVRSQIIQYILDHPAELTRVYASYFIHNEISSVVYLPMSLKLYDLRSYVKNSQFWGAAVIILDPESVLMLILTLATIALGIGLSILRFRLLGIMPLLIHFAYTFSVSVGRISGWRFIMPVDWVVQFYYSIGLAAATLVLMSLFGGRSLPFTEKMTGKKNEMIDPRPKMVLAVIAVFLSLGLSLPLAERLIPKRYPAMSAQEMIENYASRGFVLDNGDAITVSELKKFLQQDAHGVFYYGRALYPTYYEQGEFWGDDNAFSVLTRKFDRLQFQFIGSEDTLVFIQTDTIPEYFPHASDVLIIGCGDGVGVRALAIRVNDHPVFITTIPWRGLTCSLP